MVGSGPETNTVAALEPEITVIIPVYNAAGTLRPCLDAVDGSQFRDFECIILDDGSTDGSQEIVQKYPFRFIQLDGGPYGPAFLRNQGAEAAAGQLLFFIDSDVVIYPDTLFKVSDSFRDNPQIDAVFGSYDEQPGDGSFLSQYKNLMHHFVHQQSKEQASTFWSGCGAMKREVFQQAGGFDVTRYSRPSIEDIELGARIASKGHKIILNKDLQVKHLKRWTLKGLIKTDVFDRAIPWTNLILHHRDLPNDLNLSMDQRISALLAALMVLFLAAAVLSRNYWLLLFMGILFLFFVNLWDWSGVSEFYEIRLRKVALTAMTIVLSLVLAYIMDMKFLLPALAWAFACTIALPLVKYGSQTLQKMIFFSMMAMIAIDLSMLLISYPPRFVGVMLVFALAVILLNNRLYSFFLRRKGVIFTLAVFPMHVLYYLYSILAFIVSGSNYYWKDILAPKFSR